MWKGNMAFTLFCLLSFNSNSQDIFGLAQSEKYARYLFESREFQRASSEFERVCFLDSLNWSAHLYLMKSYRKSNVPTRGLDHYSFISTRLPDDQKGLFSHEKNLCLFEAEPLSFLNSSPKDSIDNLVFFKSPSLLFSHNWTSAVDYISAEGYQNSKTLSRYYQLAQAGASLRYKKPWLAGTLSTLMPGAGKVYTGYYKDGLIAFLFTGISAFQAYRGYQARGLKSGVFLIYAGLGTGLYIGNIYGSVKSARTKNKRLNASIDDKVWQTYKQWSD